MKVLVLIALVLQLLANPTQSLAQSRKDMLNQVDWKLLWNRLFALEIYKEQVLPFSQDPIQRQQQLDYLLKTYSLYTHLSFNESLAKVLEADSSVEAYSLREQIFRNPTNRQHIANFSLDDVVAPELFQIPTLAQYLHQLEVYQDRPIQTDELFLASPEGKALVEALAFQGSGKMPQDIAFVMVPGYAAHTIKDYIFEEFLQDTNTYYGRCKNRPVISQHTIDYEFLNHSYFYGANTQTYCPDEVLVNHHPKGEPSLDILHPTGQEMGNTAGYNRETTILMRQWLRDLPQQYQNKKLILLGYSKGAPVVLDILRQIKSEVLESEITGAYISPQDQELHQRILGIVTFAGVVQGTDVARAAKKDLEKTLEDRTMAEYIDEARNQSVSTILGYISPFFKSLDFTFLSHAILNQIYDIFDLDYQKTKDFFDRLLNGRELREILDGAEDLSPLQRTLWNMEHLNNKTVDQPIFFMNISALTDISMFSRPEGIRADLSKSPSVLHPQLKLNEQGDIALDFSQFSLDATFLYLSSIPGFKSAPGGLFDTQVELAHTKAMTLDQRPLADSLTASELAQLANTIEAHPSRFSYQLAPELFQGDAIDPLVLAHHPRQSLFKANAIDNIDAIDLGEFRGHHWSLFVQAIKPPEDLDTVFVSGKFPRKAFMRALLQVMGVYNLIQKSSIDDQKAGDLP